MEELNKLFQDYFVKYLLLFLSFIILLMSRYTKTDQGYILFLIVIAFSIYLFYLDILKRRNKK